MIVIDLVGDGDAVADNDATIEVKRLEDERKEREEAYLDWLEHAPQPQVIQVES